MPPVSIAKGVGLDSKLRRHRLEPVLALRTAQDVPIIEDQRFEGHACSNVSRYNEADWAHVEVLS